jgi:hypothetical protein
MAKIHSDGRVTDASVEVESETELIDLPPDQSPEPEVKPSVGSSSGQSGKSRNETPKKSVRGGRSR